MILTYYATFALTIWALAHGRSYDQAELQFQEELTTEVEAGDGRSANLKYVAAIQSSSIWARVKLRSLTVSTADARTADIVNAAPESLSDDDLSALRRACHDGLKCVAVDQLLVLRSTTKAIKARAGGDATLVRRAITKITRVLTQYTDEYHDESTYQYVEVTESDDPSAVSQSVTVILEDNVELCGGSAAATTTETGAGAKGTAAKGTGAKGTGAQAPGPQEPPFVNNGTVNYGTINNININNGTVNSAKITSPTPPQSVVLSPDVQTPRAAAENTGLDRVRIGGQPGGAVDGAAENVQTGAEKTAAHRAAVRVPAKIRDPKPARGRGNDEKSDDKNAGKSDDKNAGKGDDNNAGNHTVTLANGAGKTGGGDRDGRLGGKDVGTGGDRDEDGNAEGNPNESTENDLEVDIVSSGSGNTNAVGKGYVEDGTLNNGRLTMRDENTGVRNKGIVNRTSAKDGIINVGTVNNGKTNYGTANRSVNHGTVLQVDSKRVQQYAKDVDGMFSSVLREFQR